MHCIAEQSIGTRKYSFIDHKQIKWHTSKITLDSTLITTGDLRPSSFLSNWSLKGRMHIRLSDGESTKLKWANSPLTERNGKLGTVKVKVFKKSQQWRCKVVAPLNKSACASCVSKASITLIFTLTLRCQMKGNKFSSSDPLRAVSNLLWFHSYQQIFRISYFSYQLQTAPFLSRELKFWNALCHFFQNEDFW